MSSFDPKTDAPILISLFSKMLFMKKILAAALFLVFCAAPRNLWAQNDLDFEEMICHEAENHGPLLNPPPPNLLTDDYDLKYARFEWAVDPAVYQISGTVTTYFQTLAPAFSTLHFDLSTQMVVDAVKFHGQSVSFGQSGDFLLTIQLPTALPELALDSISITYHGAPPSTGFGSFNQSSHNGAPIVWTLSEPFGTQDWWPCKNGLNDKLDSIDVIVTCPDGNRVASNGSLVGEKTVGADKICTAPSPAGHTARGRPGLSAASHFPSGLHATRPPR